MHHFTIREWACRIVIYLAGMLILALGLILNTKTGLGASAIMSVAYTVSEGTGWDLGNMTFLLYCAFVAAQFVIKGRNRSWFDLLQLPLSLVFTRFMNLFKGLITYENGEMTTDLAVLVLAIVLTGIGAAMTVDMRLIPNPGDGIVSAVSGCIHKELGLTKNLFDVGCVIASIAVGLFYGNALLGIGLGTIISMFGVGRVMALFNHLCKTPLLRAAALGE